MRKCVILFLMFIAVCSFADVEWSICDKLPWQAKNVMPSPKWYNSQNVKFPFPTNKWFNSVIYNRYDNYSLNLYTYPQVFRAEKSYILMQYPEIKYYENKMIYKDFQSGQDWADDADKFANKIRIAAYKNVQSSDYVNFTSANIDSYSDFSSTVKWIVANESNRWMAVTTGQGFAFSYFEVSDVVPVIEFPYEWGKGNVNLYDCNGSSIISQTYFSPGDRVILEVKLNGKSSFYGVFVPSGTGFNQIKSSDNFKRIFIVLPENEKYFSIGLLPAKSPTQAKEYLDMYYNYAYNFVTDTKVNWAVQSNSNNTYATTNFKIKTKNKRNDISQEEGTVFCLFPHQYENISVRPKKYNIGEFKDTLRGDLIVCAGSDFSTTVNFKGIVPFFNYSISNEAKSAIYSSLKNDKNIEIDSVSKENTYYYGKNLAKIANLIPVADNLGDIDSKDFLIVKLKQELSKWFKYSGQTKKYFAYDSTWGGLIGVGDPNVFTTGDSFGTEQYNDHNFHYGYFIYTSALVAMYDEDFKNRYGGMVELLIKDFANTTRDDPKFPYMRSFDFYESHSWANGMGGANNNGIDMESSSEAMNAWTAIYMWGLATQQQKYIDLGIYLYVNEYEAIKNYFFDVNGKILKYPYNHNSVGRLFSGAYLYDVWWAEYSTPTHKDREVKGIQLLPMTPSMLYLGYDRDYFKSFYEEMINNSNDYYWNDIWTRFLSITDADLGFANNAEKAWSVFSDNHSSSGEIDDGGTASYTYHFIDFFRQNGSLQTGYSSNIPSYLVTKKNDGKIVYSAYNHTDSVKKVDFYNGSEYLGYMNVYAKTFMSTEKLLNGNEETKLSVFPVPYKPNNNSRYGGEGINFLGIKNGANIKIFNIAGEKVFDKTVSSDTGIFVWNAKNNSGNNVASGIYIYIVDCDGKKTKGKLAIER